MNSRRGANTDTAADGSLSEASSNAEEIFNMITSSHRIDACSTHCRVVMACLFLLPLVGSGCEDNAAGSDSVSGRYSPASEFKLIHPSGPSVTIPAGAGPTSFEVVVAGLPATRRPRAAVLASPAISITPIAPGLTMPAIVSFPIPPSNLPTGASVTVLQRGPGDVFVPVPSRRRGSAVVAETYTFGDFIAVVIAAPDAGVPSMDVGVPSMDAGVADAGVADAAVEDASVAPDAGGFCGDGIWQTERREQCDDGAQNRPECLGFGTCTFDCLFCLE